MTLIEAVQAGDVKAVQQALAATKDVNQLGPEGTTALIEAARAGRADLVRLLLDAGGEPRWTDDGGETALLKAAANGHAQVVSLLLPLGSEDEQDMARAFLKAVNAPLSPEYQYDGGTLKRKATEVAARAANFVGHEEPLKRVERQQRAEATPRNKKLR